MNMTPEQAPGAGTPSPAGQMPAPAPGDPVPASPEEQAAYEKVVAVAWQLVYDEARLPKVIDMLKGEGDPVEGLAQTAAMVIGRVASSAEESGQQIPGDVMFAAATEIFEDLANLATKAKIHDFENDPEALEGAYFRALDGFRTMLQQAGKIDQKAASADMEQLIQMDQGGQLEELFRKLAAGESGGPAPEGEEQPPEKPMPKRPGGGGLMQGSA